MPARHSRNIFLNLPVRDLPKSVAFFSALGFEFNPKFTNDSGACMIISGDAFVMLLSDPFFRTFTRRDICNTTTHTEALVAISCGSREEVDEMVTGAVRAGGAHAMDPLDHGFMYGWSFYDLDGHHWEVVWMDPAAAQ
jgi:predicted lactoylglutathione lyase